MNEELSCELTAFPYAVIFKKSGISRILNSKQPLILKRGENFFWQHLDYTDAETVNTLVNTYGIEQDVAEALCDDSTRPRYFREDEELVVILRSINYNAGSNPEDMISLRIFITRDKIITLSHRRLPLLGQIYRRLSSGNLKINSPMQLFLALAQDMTDGINDVVIDITENTADLEEKVLDADSLGDFYLQNQISDTRRKIISIRRYTAPQKEIFLSLQNDKGSFLSDDDRGDIREIYNDITKAVEDLDYCRDHMAVFREELQSKMSVSMAKIMYTISLVMVIFTPLTLLTGMLGMNVGGIPYSGSRYAFAAVCGILLLLALVIVFLMRRLKWMNY